jgi:hypothetical protein
VPQFSINKKENVMEWLKSLWARWKVQVSVVGGVLVIATAYGTCSVEPPAPAEVSEVIPTPEAVEGTTTVEVSATTSTEEVDSPTTTTETPATETISE